MSVSAQIDHAIPVDAGPSRLRSKSPVFWLLTLLVVVGSMARSNWATRLDSFTLDEACHIMAGASYAKTGSFHINPEHHGKIDSTKAVRYLGTGVALYPKTFSVHWDLGNLYVRRNARRQAIRAFELARTHCLDETLKPMLTAHIRRLQTGDLRRIPTLRNPGTE